MTRILIVSDIHSNLVALEAVLAGAGAFDRAWCLGDIVGYGPAPNECIERVRDLNAVCLAGNHDLGVLDKLSLDEFNGHARRAVLWTRGVVTPANRQWLDTLEPRVGVAAEQVTLVHASPRYPAWEYILSGATAAENFAYFETPLCFFGHTHVPRLFAVTGDDKHTVKSPGAGDVLLPGDYIKCLVNPGSVGQPRDRDPRAAYAIFDPDARSVTWFRVPYDIEKTQAAMVKAGLPRPLIERLDYGV